jgi:response regulator RpfG family c-di-GMP phosphodiesterase
MQYKILVVDDEPANLRLLERLLRGTYEVVTAVSGDLALELLSVHDISLIISDQRMPGMTGIEFLKRAAEMRPQTVRIMLTGYSDAEALVEAINSGSVYKYLTKPWVNEDLLQTAKRALQHYESMRAQRQLQVSHERLQERLRAMKEVVIRLAGEMLRVNDAGAATRAARTRNTAIQIGRTMQLGPGELEPLGIAGFLFEVSDRNVSELEDDLRFLSELPEFEEVVDILHSANESFDGSGFPNGFANEEIPLASRIVTVAQAYQHIASMDGLELTENEILEELGMLSGARLDPEIVEAFCDQDIPRIPCMPESPGIYAN